MHLKHGTYQRGYRLGCREQCCIRAYNRWSSNRYNQRVRAGQTVEWIHDTTPVADRINLLRTEYGYTFRQIAKAAGVSTHSIDTWLKGPERIKRSSVEKVMRIPLEYQLQGRKPQSSRPAVGAQRRIHAMFLRGFTEEGISRLCEVNPKTIHQIRVGRCRTIQQRTHDSIETAFNRSLLLSDPQGRFADRSRRVAREERYLPYGVWDNIDDPGCRPEEDEIPTYDDDFLLEAIRRSRTLAARGFTIGEIADASSVPRPLLYKVLHGKKKKLPDDTAKKVHSGCDLLEPLPDPVGGFANRTRTIAKKNGWR